MVQVVLVLLGSLAVGGVMLWLSWCAASTAGRVAQPPSPSAPSEERPTDDRPLLVVSTAVQPEALVVDGVAADGTLVTLVLRRPRTSLVDAWLCERAERWASSDAPVRFVLVGDGHRRQVTVVEGDTFLHLDGDVVSPVSPRRGSPRGAPGTS